MRRTGAQIIWECLVREGVHTVFGYPGGAILPAPGQSIYVFDEAHRLGDTTLRDFGGSCRIGSTRGAEMLKKAQGGDYKIDRTLFNDLIETLEIGSLCALGGGLPLPVKNALQYFDKELAPYFKKS